MPPGFGLLDTILVSIPVLLALLGLIRGAPVELASCLGCVAGVLAAWLASLTPLLHSFGQPAGPLVALVIGIAVWRLAGRMSHRLGLDTRWVSLGRLFDSAMGLSMGALRGVAMVAAACLAYAMVLVPMGMANPTDTVIYPVFLGVGTQVTRSVVASVGPGFVGPGLVTPVDVPLPPGLPNAPPAAPSQQFAAAAPLPTVPGAGLSSLIRAVVPPAVAATMVLAPPAAPPVYRPDIPVRQVPVTLIETHHNILHPRGLWFRHNRH